MAPLDTSCAESPSVDLASLAEASRWVAWQDEARGSTGKPTKTPINPATGGKAMADNPSTWGTRQAAEVRARDLPLPFGSGGIGLELGEHEGCAVGGIDLDTCRDPETGALAPWALEVIRRFATYAEVSPSGTGMKVFFLYHPADGAAIRQVMGTATGRKWARKGGDHPPGIELYISGRFFAVTGEQYPDAPAELRRVPLADVLWLIREAGPAMAAEDGDASRKPGRIAKSLGVKAGGGDGSRSAAAFKTAANVKRAGGSFADFLAALEADPVTAEWRTEKGEAQGGRELRRAWERAGEPAEPTPDADGVTWPFSYVMREEGLFYLPQPKRDPRTGEEMEGTPMRLSAAFRVLGEARDADGHGRALLLAWTDSDGREQRYALPRRLLHGEGGALAGDLEDRGLRVRTGQNYRTRLAEALSGVKTPNRIASADRTGWHTAGGRMAYVMADGCAYGDAAEKVLLAGAGSGAMARVAASGTLEGWQQGVAAPAVGNHRLALFLAAALASPLLEILGVEGGGLHLLGGSSTGKSTCLEAAASAWGSPRMGQQVRSWRSTANALEGAAVECSDALLALDEIGLADGKDVAVTMYTLAGGAGRGRADRTGALRAPKTWRSLFLSTGEVSPAAKIVEAGQRSRAGQDVRCVSVPADAGCGRGVWQTLHSFRDGEGLSNAVKAAALAHHGHAARAFVNALTRMRAEKPAELLRGLQETVVAFTRGAHVPADADGQVRRVAQRFGVIAAAGDLATELGILPWPEGEAQRAAVAGFVAWLAGRGGHGAGEAQTSLSAVRAFIGAHGSSRFSTLLLSTEQGSETEDSSRPVINRAGWRRQTVQGWEYLVLPEAWRDEVCKGLDAQQVARELDAHGYLRRGEGKNLAARVRIPGEGQPRLFVILPGLLAGGAE
ncbi:DUF927 domain-containing protein [Muricoccus pecuniae]|uniref:Uncharacterized protein (DUF927 family) n=1 Tax=Muricoccus pecuniae TaxID=693023 RepID=A0A840Y6M6_9PROT|nr:DUF927 domain-containing protein [Roseomonas pecuniae]MBB5695520.1 uncharacterized protein (DUF927 family) [Roseomonas pecuniae]